MDNYNFEGRFFLECPNLLQVGVLVSFYTAIQFTLLVAVFRVVDFCHAFNFPLVFVFYLLWALQEVKCK